MSSRKANVFQQAGELKNALLSQAGGEPTLPFSQSLKNLFAVFASEAKQSRFKRNR